MEGERCTKLRVSSGYWYENATLGRETFYAFGFRSKKWKRNNGNDREAVYPGNSFAWKDTSLGSNDKNCQVHPVNLKSFCDTMTNLHIRRILLVGDSLMGSQLESLVGLTGHNVRNFVKTSRKSNPTLNVIECPEFPVRLEFRRENLGPNHGKTNLTNRTYTTPEHRGGPENPNCVDEISTALTDNNSYFPWRLIYNETNTKTLVVLNQGAHFHSMENFSKSFDLFVKQFNSIAHPGDVVIFRSTVPGHHNCF